LVSSAIVLCRVLWHAGASVLCLVLIQELAPLFLSRCACSGSFQLGCMYRSQEASNVLHRWSCINGLASNVLTIHAGGQSGHLCVSGAGQDKGIRKSTGGAARPEQAPSQSDHHQVFNGKLEECNKTVTLYRPEGLLAPVPRRVRGQRPRFLHPHRDMRLKTSSTSAFFQYTHTRMTVSARKQGVGGAAPDTQRRGCGWHV